MAGEDDRLRVLSAEALNGEFQVYEAATGKSALQQLKARRPELVLLDVDFSTGDGLDVCNLLRELAGNGRLPILLMTSVVDSSFTQEAYAAGATDFIAKPVDFTQLTHRVRHLLRSADAFRQTEDVTRKLRRAQRIAKLAYWELTLDDMRFQWSGGGMEVFGVHEGSGEVADLLRVIHEEDRDRIRQLLEQGERHRTDYRIVLPGGEQRVIHQEAELVSDAVRGKTQLFGAAQDVTERRKVESRAQKLAYFDSLTGLPNRAFLRRYLGDAMADAERYNHAMAVMALDLDLFKRVNDMFGHATGDMLLQEVARRLADCVRSGDFVAQPTSPDQDDNVAVRMGGDEFIVVLKRVRSPEDAVVVARRILEQLSQSYLLGNKEAFVSCSIGIATYPENGNDPDQLLQSADAALYHAKESGRNKFKFFTDSIHRKAKRRLALENGLRTALVRAGISVKGRTSDLDIREHLELHFQPKVAVPSGDVVGAEALLRWESESLGNVSPAEFVPVAEDTGLIVALGEWVLRTACRRGRVWSEEGRPLRIAVNVSARQFREPGFADLVGRVLEETEFPPHLLELEITEGVMMQDAAESERVVGALKALGVFVALDDFGTGYSSLSYLTRFPIDLLKIDRSFVWRLGEEKADTIVSAIIALARSLEIGVVAEGVETAQQLRFLQHHGEMEVQGYFFAKPMPEHELVRWIIERTLTDRPRLIHAV